ncbi:acireductone dioxygenase [Nostocales cyanobacterium HT-58-2]|nr:acireductone dioxygenase [Nostocales cyanobacterium HT-58-2]
MAILLLENGTIHSDLVDIARELSPLGIYLTHYESSTSGFLADLLSQEILTDKEKNYILESHNSLFAFLKKEKGYVGNDLLAVHPGLPYLDTLIATCSSYHTHTAPEALYVLSGNIIFGFVQPDGQQVQIILHPQDYIHIPAGVEHWLSPTASLHCKAVRYLTIMEGCIPYYTGTQKSDFLRKQR